MYWRIAAILPPYMQGLRLYPVLSRSHLPPPPSPILAATALPPSPCAKCRASASSFSFLAASCRRLESLELGAIAQGGVERWRCNRRLMQIAVPKVGWETRCGMVVYVATL